MPALLKEALERGVVAERSEHQGKEKQQISTQACSNARVGCHGTVPVRRLRQWTVGRRGADTGGQWHDLKAIAGAQCARRMDWQDAPRCDIHPDNALARPSDHPQRTSALTILRLDAIVLDVRHQELRLRVREELR